MTINDLYRKAAKIHEKEALAIWGKYLADQLSHGKAWFMLKRLTKVTA